VAGVRAVPAGDHDYERRGLCYSAVRQPDPRIEEQIHAALGDARTVVNVGAGAGSHEPSDRYVIAIEPSASMRAQRGPDRVPAIDATAERLPLDDGSVDAAMALVTVHQWSDPEAGLRELRRVSRGSVVVMTFDGDALDRFWLAEYAPELIAAERKRYPKLDWICNVLGGAAVDEVPVPIDCTDGFTEAFYARPEAFLDPAVRSAQSAWAFVEDGAEARAVERLRTDLESGEWERRFGALREQPTFAGSLRLITAGG
jgi:SAM-dependent methyltransferase